MRKILFLLLVLTGNFCIAQKYTSNESENPFESFIEMRDSIFSNVNLQNVPTGLLREYGFFIKNPEHFSLKKQSDTININEWRLLYGGMVSSIVNNNSIKFPDIKDINSVINKNLNDQIVLLPILYIDFNSFKIDINSDNFDTIKIVNKEKLYKTNTLYAIAPSTKKIRGNNVQFCIDKNYIFSIKNFQ